MSRRRFCFQQPGLGQAAFFPKQMNPDGSRQTIRIPILWSLRDHKMNKENCNTNISLAEITPAEWSQAELLQRAGGLVREALADSPTYVWQMHREDMLQTAALAFLELADEPAGYAYAAARNALKNYRWIHIRGLNGGWKSLACIEKGYSVLNFADTLPEDNNDDPQTAVDRLTARTGVVPCPPEPRRRGRQAGSSGASGTPR